MPTGLRQRKKDNTRRALLQVADQLFRDCGYQNTTLEQICDHTDVSMRTFFRYFDSKQDLAVAVGARAHKRILERLANAAPDAILADLRDVHVELADDMDRDDRSWARIRLAMSEPALMARFLTLDLEREQLIAARLVTGPGEDDRMRATLTASLITSGVRAALIAWISTAEPEPARPRVERVFDLVNDLAPRLSSPPPG